ncbi:MAG: hypothetical protein J0I19_12425 [Alphaproteobacteria bacterium]|nr:hypothetical protein [Alphaproteobacteria bacterium]
MGSSITTVPAMIAYSGDLRRQANITAEPGLAEKLRASASQLEKAALVKAGIDNPRIGKMLDLIV